MKELVPEERIVRKILWLRNHKVMLDADLAELYGVATKALNQAVKRNRDRFPPDFLFQLSTNEKDEVVTICDHLRRLKFSKSLPYAFTEHGALMLASVLNSRRAVDMSVVIIRVFIRLREMLTAHKDLMIRIARLEQRSEKQGKEIRTILEIIQRMMDQPVPDRRKIGFR